MAYYPPTIDTDTLEGTNGFDINGATTDDRVGTSVASAGDVNGDGFDDVILSGRDRVGNLVYNYVVFGTGEPLPADFNVSSLDGENGFRIITAAPEKVWYFEAAGDINGDGYDDLMVGTSNDADPYGYDDIQVIYGKAEGFERLFSIADIDGENGFTLNAPPRTTPNYTIESAGDTNGDGYDDVLITIDYNARLLLGSADGIAHDAVVTDVAATVFNPTQWGFAIPGGIGDINGDGFDDIAIGEAVLFGSAEGFPSDLTPEMLDGSNGFLFDPDLNRTVSAAGDVNGDGIDDFIIGNPNARPHGHIDGGEAYVVFGKSTGFDATLDLEALDGTDGFAIRGSTLAGLGVSVSGPGDINGDGFDDVLVQAGYGRGYVAFGRATYHTAGFDVEDLDGRNGFAIVGGGPYSGLDASAGLGDFNGDGFADMAFGESQASPDGKYLAGTAHIVFGLKPTEAVTRIDAAGDQTMRGGLGNDTLISYGGDDHLIGDVGNDRLVSADGTDILDGGLGDDTYVIYRDHADTIIDAGGIDTISAKTSWSLMDNPEIENLEFSTAGNWTGQGNGLDNIIIAGAGNNRLFGDAGNDTLSGGAGNDLLSGGVGADLLSGGIGADRFDFFEFSTHIGTGRDVITDFEAGVDTINLAYLDADTNSGSNQAFAFIGDEAFGGVAGQLRQAAATGDDGAPITLIEGDVNGDGVADFQIELRGQHVLSVGDFIL